MPQPNSGGSNAAVKPILIGTGICVALIMIASYGAYLDTQRQQQQNLVAKKHADSVSTAPAEPTPTPELSNSEKLSKGKEMINPNFSSHYIKSGTELLAEIPKAAPEYAEAQKLIRQGGRLHKDAQSKEAKEHKAAIERTAKEQGDSALLGPMPDNRGWNGKVFIVDRYLRDTLNDYDSAEYIEWSPVVRLDTKDGPYWTVRLKLRAKNAFGGYVLKEVYFLMRQNQVVSAVGL